MTNALESIQKAIVPTLAASVLLALSGAGVSIARAEGDTAAEAAPVCRVAATTVEASEVNAAVERARAQAEARAAAATSTEDDPKIVVLNSRGYNYSSGTTLDLSAFIELERAAAAGR